MDKIKHLHLMLRAECETAPGPNDEQKVYDKVINLIKDVKMNVFMEPKVKYMPDVGNEGLTYLAGLETSHTSFHAWDKPAVDFMTIPNSTLIQADMYTCGCMGANEIKKILEFLGEYNPKLINLLVFDRAHHESLDTPIIKIKVDLTKSKKSYSKFIETLKIDYTSKFKKRLLKLAA